mgnify:CR=1 FL=1
MTEIPEHLLKRAQAARDKAADDAATPAAAAGDSRIPDHLLERSKAARGDGGAVAVAEKASAVVTSAPSAGLPVGAGPGGHTQRLLTVVKSGSIQETKAAQHQSEVDLPDYEEYWNSASRKGYSGTAIFTKEKPIAGAIASRLRNSATTTAI